MVRTVIKAVLAALGALAVTAAQAFHVFACEPEWAALTQALMPQATVFSATHVLQDPHHIEARPALIAQLRRASLAVCTGASLEAGWLPMLQQRAGNAAIQNGQPGMFYATEHVELMDAVQGAVGAFAGDVHGQGNPHVHADPHRLLKVAEALRQRLVQLQPDQAQAIDARHRQFEATMRSRIADWEKRAAILRGRDIVGQHTSLRYLWAWLGVRQVADLEPKPGMPPTPGHLDKTLAQLKSRPAMAIVVALHQDARAGKWLASQLGPATPLLLLPATVTELGEEALLAWYERVVSALVQSAR
jgi:zinc/manganese transport system substrate-binding protein